MRHARPEDLGRLTDLLRRLRALPQLKERTPGSFYLRSSGFLHFHIDGDDIWADLKVPGPDFDRHRITTPTEQRQLVSAIEAFLEE